MKKQVTCGAACQVGKQCKGLRQVNAWHIQETKGELEWLEDNEQREEMSSGRYVWDKIRKYLTGHVKD